MKHLIVILLVIKLGAVNGYAQQSSDFESINEQVDRAWEMMGNDLDSALHLAQSAMLLSESLEYKKGQADCANAIGVLYLEKQAFKEAKRHFEIALTLRSSLRDLNGKASVLHNMAGLFADQGNFPEAVKKAFQCINIWEALEETNQLGKAYNTLSNIYSSNGDADLAMAYTQKSLELLKQGDDLDAIADAQYNLAEQFRLIDDLDKALQLFESTLIIFRDSLGDLIGQGDVYNALGSIALEKRTFDEAIQYFNESERLFLSADDQIGLFDVYTNLGLLEETRLNYNQAVYYYQKAKMVLGPEASLEYQHYLATQFANVYESLEDYQRALDYQKVANHLDDSLFNENKQSELAQLQVSFETERMAKANILHAYQAQQRTFQRNLFMTISAGLLLLLGVGGLAYRQRKKANLLLIQQREMRYQREIGTLMKEQEYQLVKGRLKGQVEERRRIALEVNDGLASKVAAVNWQLEAFKDQFSDEIEPLEKIQTAIKDIFKDIDQVVQNLKTNNPNSGGLEFALDKLKVIIEKESRIKTEIQFWGNLRTLKPELEVAVYRILRELTGNVIRHSNATELRVSLSQTNDQLRIMVEDNGRGFDPNHINLLGFGLVQIERLVQNLEGHFHIDSGLGGGTTIVADLPV